MNKFIPQEIEKLNNGLTRVVPVLASFDGAGSIKPLYVRINEESYRILSCYATTYGPLTMYRCKVSSYGREKELNLTYHSRERCWTTQL